MCPSPGNRHFFSPTVAVCFVYVYGGDVNLSRRVKVSHTQTILAATHMNLHECVGLMYLLFSLSIIVPSPRFCFQNASDGTKHIFLYKNL